MEVVKLAKDGRVVLPAELLRELGITGDDSWLIAEAAGDGAIPLRPAAVYPIEIYSDERIKEFERENELDPEVDARAQAVINRRP